MPTWKLYGVHLESTHCPHGNHAVSIWKLHDSHMETMGFLCGHNMVTTSTPHDFQVDTTWFPCGYHVVSMWHHVVSMWTPCGFQMDTTWFQMWTPGGFQVDTTWFTQDTTWFPYGQPMVSTWTSHGFHMHTMWCPGNHMKSSTKKQLCIKPTGFLVSLFVKIKNRHDTQMSGGISFIFPQDYLAIDTPSLCSGDIIFQIVLQENKTETPLLYVS